MNKSTVGSSSAALFAAIIGFFVVTLDSVVVNVALNEIRIDLDASMSTLQWIVEGYMLFFAALLLSAGAISDRIGARRAYFWGMAGFVVASVACGFAPTAEVLIGARVLQGATAALMLPASMALLGEAFSDHSARARAVAMWSMGGAFASISGPVLGGVLSLVSWRMIFLINLPVGIIALVLVLKARRSDTREVPLDLVGQVAAILAVGGLVFATIEVGSAGFFATSTILAFLVGVLGIVLFLFSQRAGKHPMLPLELLRNRTLLVSITVGFTYMVGYFGLPFLINLFVQQERGFTPFQSGLMFIPMMVAGAIITPYTARLAEKFTARTLIIGGMALMAFGLLVLGLLPQNVDIWIITTAMVLVGAAAPLVIPPINAMLLNSFDSSVAGTVSGAFNTSRQVGGAMAVAAFGSILGMLSSFYQGYMISLIIAAVLAAFASAVSIALPKAARSK